MPITIDLNNIRHLSANINSGALKSSSLPKIITELPTLPRRNSNPLAPVSALKIKHKETNECFELLKLAFKMNAHNWEDPECMSKFKEKFGKYLGYLNQIILVEEEEETENTPNESNKSNVAILIEKLISIKNDYRSKTNLLEKVKQSSTINAAIKLEINARLAKIKFNYISKAEMVEILQGTRLSDAALKDTVIELTTMEPQHIVAEEIVFLKSHVNSYHHGLDAIAWVSLESDLKNLQMAINNPEINPKTQFFLDKFVPEIISLRDKVIAFCITMICTFSREDILTTLHELLGAEITTCLVAEKSQIRQASIEVTAHSTETTSTVAIPEHLVNIKHPNHKLLPPPIITGTVATLNQ